MSKSPRSKREVTTGHRWPGGRDILVCCGLAAATWFVFARTLENGFVHFDDDGYVMENSAVRAGLTQDSILYAFTTFDLGNWIPLTWLSYELDVALQGFRPEAFHRTDLLLHALNILLVYLFLRTTTGTSGNSAIVAALWGLHPLRVESVAWIAERKDVLSTFFMLLAMCCYARWATTRKGSWYVMLVVTFIAGLMSKSMLVTLPVILLALDFWPLDRWSNEAAGSSAVMPSTARFRTRQVTEKAPLFLISLVFCIIAVQAQQSQAAMVSLDLQSPLERALHAMESYGWYLQKTLIPVNLCAFYPLNKTAHDWSLIALGTTAILGASAWAMYRRKTQPWLITGMVWFFVAFLPVVGIIQVGSQAWADRYSYVPSIGLFVFIVWELNYWLDAIPRGAAIRVVVSGVMLLFLSVLTELQVGYWFDARTLWTHTLEVDPQNWLGHFHLGRLATRENDAESALKHFRRTLELSPGYADAHLLIAAIHQIRREWELAERHYHAALQIQPDDPNAIIQLAVIARSTSRFDEAKRLLESCPARPGYEGRVHLELGQLARDQGRLSEALQESEQAVRVDPQLEMGYEFMASVCEEMKQTPEAIKRLEQALMILPSSTRLRIHLAQLLHEAGQKEAAIRHMKKASALNPENAALRQMLQMLERDGQ